MALTGTGASAVQLAGHAASGPIHVSQLCTSDIFSPSGYHVTLLAYPFQGPIYKLEFHRRAWLSWRFTQQEMPTDLPKYQEIRRT